jgi:hypothetical protein
MGISPGFGNNSLRFNGFLCSEDLIVGPQAGQTPSDTVRGRGGGGRHQWGSAMSTELAKSAPS